VLQSVDDPATARAISAGTDPAPHLHPEVVAAMSEVGVDLSNGSTSKLTSELEQAYILITMGSGDQCPSSPVLSATIGHSRIQTRASRSSSCDS
jgi:protein-tyrosine-phosphatase